MAYTKKTTEHAFKTFSRDLKSESFGNVVLLFGDEDYLVDWALKSILSLYGEKEAVNFDNIRLYEDCSVQDITEACETFSLFSNKKTVSVKNYGPLKSSSKKALNEDDLKELTAYLNNPNEDTVLVFVCDEIDRKSELTKTILKTAKSYEFEKLDASDLTGFIEKRFRSQKISISRALVRMLIDETGYLHKESTYKLHNLENDIVKIIAVSDGTEIKEEDIMSTLRGDLDTFVFNFLDAVSSNKKSQAFQLLENIMADGNETYSLLALLISNYELLLQVKELSNEGLSQYDIASKLSMNEYRVKKACGFSERLSKEKITDTLIQLYETDRNIKTGMLDQRIAMELVVGRL